MTIDNAWDDTCMGVTDWPKPVSSEVTEEKEEAWKMKEMSIQEARAILSKDNVNHPEHYQSEDGIECIEAIRAQLNDEEFRGFCKGNAIKYIWREELKGSDESLKKAVWYLNKALDS